MPESNLKDKTARGLFWGLMNNGAMQLLNLVFGIITARILSKEDYGLASDLAIFTAVASALQESGFISALIKRKDATPTDYASVFWFNTTCSLLLYVILWFCAPLIVLYFHDGRLLWLSRYAFIGFFCASFSIVPRSILMKQLRVKEQTAIGMFALVLSGAVGIGMALGGMTYWSIITQNIVFVTAVSFLSWHYTRWKPAWRFSARPIREMFPFSCKLLVTNIFNCINNSVFTLVFGKIYTPVEVGTYSQADKWNKMGSQLITGMVQSVAQPMFVQVGDERDRLVRAFRKMLRFTSLVSFPAMLGLALVAPEFIVLLIGEKWLASAHIMQVLCVAGAFMPITALFFNFLISRGKSGVYMWNTLAQGLLVLVLLFCIKRFDWRIDLSLPFLHVAVSGIPLMVSTYVAVYLLWLLIWHHFLWRDIRLPLTAVLKDTVPFLLTAAACMAAAYFATRSLSSPLLLLAARAGMVAILYVGILWMTHADILRESIDYLVKRRKHPRPKPDQLSDC